MPARSIRLFGIMLMVFSAGLLHAQPITISSPTLAQGRFGHSITVSEEGLVMRYIRKKTTYFPRLNGSRMEPSLRLVILRQDSADGLKVDCANEFVPHDTQLLWTRPFF